jgi:hypothetical protein
MFDEDDNPTVAFETSPDDFLSIVRLADSASAQSDGALVWAAEKMPPNVRIYWDRDI